MGPDAAPPAAMWWPSSGPTAPTWALTMASALWCVSPFSPFAPPTPPDIIGHSKCSLVAPLGPWSPPVTRQKLDAGRGPLGMGPQPGLAGERGAGGSSSEFQSSLALMCCVTLDKSLASLGHHHLISKWNSSKCKCVHASGLTVALQAGLTAGGGVITPHKWRGFG